MAGGRSQRHLREFHRQDSGGVGRYYTLTVPTVTGTATNGSTLTGTNGTFSPSGATITRQWYRDGAPISGATGATYVLTAADVGKKVYLVNSVYNSIGGVRYVASAGTATVV